MPWPPPTPGCGPDYHRSVGLSAEVGLDGQPGLRVERAERLVEEPQVRIDGQGSGDSHPLLHSLGKHRRVRVGKPLEAQLGQQFRGPQPAIGLSLPSDLQPKLHVLPGRPPRTKR